MAVSYPSATRETVSEVAKAGGPALEAMLTEAIGLGVKSINLRNDRIAWTCRIDRGDTIAKMPSSGEPAPVAVLRATLHMWLTSKKGDG